jgi:ribosomal protein L11 methylase PrmA
MPIDEEELDRIDLKHRLYTILLGEKLFIAPIGNNPQRVLDLGTGSGRFSSSSLQ